MQQPPRQSMLVTALALAAIPLLVAAYLSPVWWVSLTAPNYPEEAFPDGIRIQFSFKGIANGCTSAPKTSRVAQETIQEDLGWRSEEGTEAQAKAALPENTALDCLHEMNTINHYVGMHPMGMGAPVELQVGKFIIAFFGVMLLGFAIPVLRARLLALGVGFAGVSGWMVFELFATGNAKAYVDRYVADAGKYFPDPERIRGWGGTLTAVTIAVAVVLIASMVFITLASWRWPRFQLVLGLVPALLPVFFVGDFAGWLWFFGHNLHPWGAFSVKPFMPTVFGDGKVAQFTTHSYPHTGFALLALMSALALAAVMRRRLELGEAAPAAQAPSRLDERSPLVTSAEAAGPKS